MNNESETENTDQPYLEKIPTNPQVSEDNIAGDALGIDLIEKEKDNKILKNKLDKAKIELKEISDKIQQRRHYALWFLLIPISWLIFVGYVIYSNGISLDRASKLKFSISDTVIIVLLGSSLVNVLGPSYIVARYLFDRPDKETSS